MKQRKTRQQKIISELRRQLQTSSHEIVKPVKSTPSASYSLNPTMLKTKTLLNTNNAKPTTHPYFMIDLTKTFVTTGSIIALEIFFFLLINSSFNALK